MVVLRYILLAAIAFMGVERLRRIFYYLQATETYNNRDFLQYYLLAKAVVSGINPYLPLDQLANIFLGNFQFFTHPAPCTPFLTILFIPWSSLNVIQFSTLLFIIEMLVLLLVAYFLPKLWDGKASWMVTGITFIILIAWNPVANDLSYGQLSILLTALLLTSLLALKKQHHIQAGVLIGLTVAIKLITWPLIIYLAIKKDWRTLLSSLSTALGMNLIAMFIIGIKPFFDYYLHVSSQVFSAYEGTLHNFSLMSIGYRLFEGTGSNVFSNFISAPPLIYLPQLAFVLSGLLVIIFLAWGVWHASRSINLDTAFAIMICVIIITSPVAWEHYFIMLIIPLVVLFRSLWNGDFPPWRTISFIIICLLLFLFNEQLVNIIFLINGGSSLVIANHNQITFASSLLAWLPILEVLVFSILLWRSNQPVMSENAG